MVAQDGIHSSRLGSLVSSLVVSVDEPLLVSDVLVMLLSVAVELGEFVLLDASVVIVLVAPVPSLVVVPVVVGAVLDAVAFVVVVALVVEVPPVSVGVLVAPDEVSVLSEEVFWPLPSELPQATRANAVHTENTVTRKARRVGTMAERRDDEAMERMGHALVVKRTLVKG